jgi:uncharacterized membrane protein YhaH (DUF805 family)
MAVLRKYADFSGRARRQEYWMFHLISAVISIVLWLLIFVPLLFTRDANAAGPLMMLFLSPVCLYSLAVFIPSLAVLVRRLHDIGKGGVWLLIAFVPFVGGIILLVFTCLDSEPGPNLYGPSPKYGGGNGYGYAPPYPPQPYAQQYPPQQYPPQQFPPPPPPPPGY